MKFSEMAYTRVDVEKVKEEYRALTEKVKNAASADDVIDALMEHEKLKDDYETSFSLAYVRHTIDTRDEFYKAEQEFSDNAAPELSEAVQEFFRTVFESKFRKGIEKKTGELFFTNIEMDLKTFSPEIIPLLQQENSLVSDYEKLIASAKIPFDGKELNLSQLGVYKENDSREVRRAAYKAESAFYMSHADKLDELFDKLVKCRTEIAHKLGFEKFTELGYLRMTRNCYDPAMVKVFRENIIKDIVPAVSRLNRERSARIGIPYEDMKIYDSAYKFKDGNPRPCGSSDDILAAARKMFEEMSPQTKEFVGVLYDNELLDVLTRPGKAVGGYCTEFPAYKAPFIFANFNGTTGDVEVMTHEAGHAFAGYTARNFEISETRQPTMEACECHSMSMEFLAWPWMKSFYGDDVERANISHLEGSFEFLPYGTMVDHFQHVIYDDPDLTPAERHEKWLELEKIYRPDLDFGDIEFYAAGRGWQRQHHIYHYPFYYIDYCLAQTVALEIWELSRRDYKDAWNKYISFVEQGGKMTFTGLLEHAGIASPFKKGALGDVAEEVGKWLDERK